MHCPLDLSWHHQLCGLRIARLRSHKKALYALNLDQFCVRIVQSIKPNQSLQSLSSHTRTNSEVCKVISHCSNLYILLTLKIAYCVRCSYQGGVQEPRRLSLRRLVRRADQPRPGGLRWPMQLSSWLFGRFLRE